ncbi:MAG: YggS family pyridoxal phosphate-dependent enzyme [Rhodospirillales bacterium]
MSVPHAPENVNIVENIESLKTRAAKAASGVGRDPLDILLVAVSKMHSGDAIRASLDAGQRVFGESRVQEAMDKWPPIKAEYPDVRLHLIGPLQTNKVREAVALFDVIQTVDRPKLANKLSEEMRKQNRMLPCFIQINTGEEDQKAGILPAESDSFISNCRDKEGLRVEGLMCIPPQYEEPSLHFAFLREIAARNSIDNLSMGMSTDFEIAIAMGATQIRLGTAIFGSR